MTAELPPPSGAPYPPPGAPQAAASAPAAPAAPVPPASPYAFPPPPGQGGAGTFAGDRFLARPRIPVPGTNGLAIAALVCGIVGLVPLASVVAIVLGVVALNQLRDRIQRGKGMAIAGLVLGAVWLVGWGLFIAAVVTDQPSSTSSGVAASRSPSGDAAAGSEVFVDDLKPGDCYSGGRKDTVDLVTVIPCTSPHESQAVTTFELPAGPYPGEKAVTKAAEEGCTDKADPLITDQAYDDLEPHFFYPSDSYTWRGDRTVVCVVEAHTGTTTGSALR